MTGDPGMQRGSRDSRSSFHEYARDLSSLNELVGFGAAETDQLRNVRDAVQQRLNIACGVSHLNSIVRPKKRVRGCPVWSGAPAIVESTLLNGALRLNNRNRPALHALCKM